MPQLSRLKQNLNQLFSFPNLWLVAIWGFVLLGVVSRLFVYLDCQNLWLDEAFLAKSIYHTPWTQLLGKPLEWGQATPLGFLLITKSIVEHYQHRHNFHPDNIYVDTSVWAGSLPPLIQKSKHNRVFAILQNNDWQYIEEIKDFYPQSIHLDSGFSLFIIDKACTSPALLGR